MIVEVSNQLFPEAKEVFLQDNSCVGTLNSDTEIWLINTMLDGCDTSLTTNDDGTLTFSNKLQANAFRKRDNIPYRALCLHLNDFFNSIFERKNSFSILSASLANECIRVK